MNPFKISYKSDKYRVKNVKTIGQYIFNKAINFLAYIIIYY